MERIMSEKEKAKPIETEAMVLNAGEGPQTVDVLDASPGGLALMEERVKNQKKMIAIAISLTSPSQWTVFAGTGKDGIYRESIYPTGGAADTILRRAFGLSFTRKVKVEDTGDGKMATCVLGLKRDGEVFEEFVGYRYMQGFIKNEANLRSGAEENAKSKAVRDLLGLRFRTPAELKEMGLDITKMERRAEFQTHEQDAGSVVAPFGQQKGKPLTELTDDNLDWLANAVKKSIADPEKAKFKAKNQSLLDACREEYKRRHAKSEPAKEEKKSKKKAKGKKEETVDPKTGEVTSDDHDYGPPALTDDEIAAMEDEAREPGQEG